MKISVPVRRRHTPGYEREPQDFPASGRYKYTGDVFRVHSYFTEYRLYRQAQYPFQPGKKRMGFFFLDFRDGPAYNSGIEADEEFERDRGGLNDLPGRRRGIKKLSGKRIGF